jgi:hypothetical protein
VVELLRQAIPATALVVPVDPGKVSNRVWLTSGERGLSGEPVSLSVPGEGITTLAGLMTASGVAGPPTIAVEATGRLPSRLVSPGARASATRPFEVPGSAAPLLSG